MEKLFTWDPTTNLQLLKQRGVSFEDVVFYIQKGCLIDMLVHNQQDEKPQQRLLVVEIDASLYLVPYIETDESYFLQTIALGNPANRQQSGNAL